MLIREVKKGTLEISAKENRSGCQWELESETEARKLYIPGQLDSLG